MKRKHTPETIEEIEKMLDEEMDEEDFEEFHGTKANLPKIKLYYEIEEDLKKFMQCCDRVQEVNGHAPSAKEECPMLWIEFKFIPTLDREKVEMLTDIMKKADDIAFTTVGYSVRIVFLVRDTWLE